MSNTKKKKLAQEILQEYTSGTRKFHDLNLIDQSFYKEDLGAQENPDLSEADFTGCNLRGANFTDCTLNKANFTGCDLKGTNFKEAKLQEAKFNNAKAGSQNSQIENTIFFISFLVVTFATIGVIFLLVNSRQAELDVIQKYGADFLLLAFLVPIGYFTHLLATGTKMSYRFWASGILVFVLKTFDQPLSGFCGNLIFLVMACTLVNPIKIFWKKRVKLSWDFVRSEFLPYWLRSNTLGWNYLPELLSHLANCFIFLLLNLFTIIAIIISFFPLESNLLSEINNDFLFWISLAFSTPAIIGLFFSIATYSVLFDSDSKKTYEKIFKNFVFMFFTASSFSSYFYEASVIIYDIGFSSIFNNIIPKRMFPLFFFCFLILILWLIISLTLRSKLIVRIMILGALAIGFLVALHITSSSMSISSNHIDNLLLSSYINFSNLCLLSFSVLLAFNFATLYFESKNPAKILAWWYFAALVFPLLVVSGVTFFNDGISSQFDWNEFLIPTIVTLILWLIFLLYVSVRYIHDLLNKLLIHVSNHLTKLYLQTFLRGCLFFSVSIVMVSYFSDWLMDGKSDISALSILFENLPVYILILFFVVSIIAVLSLIVSTVFSFLKHEISESKSSEIKEIKSKYSGFRDLVVFIKTLDSTNFEGADLQEADFTKAQLEGVNFRRAKIEGAIWSGATGLDGSAVGNTYLQYPKVRNWVSLEEKVC